MRAHHSSVGTEHYMIDSLADDDASWQHPKRVSRIVVVGGGDQDCHDSTANIRG